MRRILPVLVLAALLTLLTASLVSAEVSAMCLPYPC